MKKPEWFHDNWAALRGVGPVSVDWHWPHDLKAAFPGRRLMVESWAGDGANFARYRTPHGPLFLKYLPAGEREPRYFRRFQREIEYLRDLAPLTSVPHAPFLHAALDPARRRAHLLLPDLTDTTWGWGYFEGIPEQLPRLRDVARLIAHFHAAWMQHPALQGHWSWQPQAVCAEAADFAATYSGPYAAQVQQASTELPSLLRKARHWTLAHGDLHSGQVLWPRDGSPPLLIDYGQVHASIPGEDLAHLLGVRLSAAERTRYGPGIRESYWFALEQQHWHFETNEKVAQERAGLALNLLATARQVAQEPGRGVSVALDNVAQTWQED